MTTIALVSCSSNPSNGGDAGACGNGSGGSATLSGTIDGNTLVARDALLQTVTLPLVSVTDTANACQSPTPLTSQVLLFLFSSTTISPGPVAVGTGVQVNYAQIDHCNSVNNADGASGTVTVTKFDGCTLDASYDVTMKSGDHITGSFHSVACSPAADAGTCP